MITYMFFLINVDDNDSPPYVAAGIAVAIIGVLLIMLVCIIAVVVKRVCCKRPKSTKMIVNGCFKCPSPSTPTMDSEEGSARNNSVLEAQFEHKVWGYSYMQ